MSQPRPPAVWFTEERPRKPRLSRERIARAAVELLDAEGVTGFSMRRLAARLGAGVMSAYEYVRSKEEVLDLAMDQVFAEIELDDSGTEPWRETLTRQLHQSRQMMKRHPWAPSLMATRPLLGPNFLARSELFYAALARAGLQGPQLLAAVGTLTYYVQGYTAAENVWSGWMRDSAEEAELRRQVQDYLRDQAALYPALTRHAQLSDDDFDGQFQRGLDLVLDGIQAQLHQRP
ncbi:DNA-binding transcriptional regulator, AcrR family [Thermomonospora echinospora]|uniref:DNA-binding transcriptional regulator, AcrR family n=1 Tax=Thermomonospora echinospora TaxID=1992 RepID=A0A1H6DG97_9ACTN|nr:TetR/AcrR family transcriptional regulator [Thermomonospora echinospora]SEG84497.1 DNA-binding transcriptional regulator, AcrR family [Thermomonospora echinospora]